MSLQLQAWEYLFGWSTNGKYSARALYPFPIKNNYIERYILGLLKSQYSTDCQKHVVVRLSKSERDKLASQQQKVSVGNLLEYLTCVAFIQCLMACWTNLYFIVWLWLPYHQFITWLGKCIYVCNSLKDTRKLISANMQNVHSGKNFKIYGIVLMNVNLCPCCLQTVWLIKLVVSTLCTKRNSSQIITNHIYIKLIFLAAGDQKEKISPI